MNNNIIQQLENLPQEILSQRRFFPVGEDKIPHMQGWSNPKNQNLYSEVDGLKGFDTCGHGVAPDYLFLDFDAVLDEQGTFTTPLAEQWYNFIHSEAFGTLSGCYCEKSVSKRGLHILAIPTAGKFKKICATDKNAIQFGDGAKLEIFYGSGGRYCLLTGNVFNCKPNAQICTGEEVDEVFEQLLRLLEENKPQETKHAGKTSSSKNSQQDSREEILKMLDAMPAAEISADEWRTVGMILKAEGLSLEDFDKWSSLDKTLDKKGKPRYDKEACIYQWGTFTEPEDSSNGVRVGTLAMMSKRFGYKPPRRPEKFTRQPAPMDDDDKVVLSDEQRTWLFSGDLSDLDNARRIEYFFGNQIRYALDTDEWLTFGNGVWENFAQKNSAVSHYATRLADILQDNSKKAEEETIARNLKKSNKISGALTLLKCCDSLIIRTKDLDEHPTLLNTPSGVVDLDTGDFYEHTNPALLLTQKCNAVYRSGYQSELVNRFLAEILPDEKTRRAVLRYLGYALTGVVRDHKALIGWGAGRNGKGTLTRLLRRVFGDYCTELSKWAIIDSGRPKDSGAPSPELMILKKKRLALVEELPPNAKIDAGTFKNLTGGDRVSARELHKNYSTEGGFDPTHKLFLSGNHLPALDDVRDIGLTERLLNVNFNQSFIKNPDTKLSEKLSTPDALSGMLSLLVEEAQAFLRDGLIETEAMKAATKNYLEENDFVKDFLDENFTFSPNLSARRKEVLDLLKTTHPALKFRRDKDLTELILKIDGITKGKNEHNANIFRGIGRKDAPAQEALDDFAGEPLSPNDDMPF